MKLKIIPNPDTIKYETMTKAVMENYGYCPCMIERSEDTKCCCKEFKEQNIEGECHCQRFIKILI
jgi:hypothetical protein